MTSLSYPAPSSLVSAVQRSVAARLSAGCRAAGVPCTEAGRFDVERLALSDICETLLTRAEALILCCPEYEELHPANRLPYLSMHLRAALLGWLMAGPIDQIQAELVRSTGDQLQFG